MARGRERPIARGEHGDINGGGLLVKALHLPGHAVAGAGHGAVVQVVLRGVVGVGLGRGMRVRGGAPGRGRGAGEHAPGVRGQAVRGLGPCPT